MALSRINATHGGVLSKARDENGCTRLSGGDAFTVILRDSKENQFFGHVEDRGNGKYTAGFQINVSGRYELYVLLGMFFLFMGDFVGIFVLIYRRG